MGEIPHLQAAVSRFQGKPFEILTVSADTDRQALINVVETMSLPGIHLWDGMRKEGPVYKLYNVRNIPAWFLIDDQGVIRKRNFDGKELIAAVEAILSPASEGEKK